MKRILVITLILLLPFLMAACGSKKNDIAKVTAEEAVEAGIDAEDTDEDQYSNEVIPIIKVWRNQPIRVEAADGKPGIKQFASAFCKTYPDFSPGQYLLEYLKDPARYEQEKRSFCWVRDESSLGFISSQILVQVVWELDCCYWKRDNGHILFAAHLAQGSEAWDSELEDDLITFYDYDPATGIMTPEPELSEKVEELGNNYDTYIVNFPVEGKDISMHVYNFEDEQDGEFEVTDDIEYKLIWNGHTFEIPDKL